MVLRSPKGVSAGCTSPVSSMGDRAALIQDSSGHVQPGGNNSRAAAKLREKIIMCRDDGHLRSFLCLRLHS